MEIKFSATELILLLSRIGNDEKAFELEDRIARKFLLKLFSAFGEIVLPTGTLPHLVPVGVTEDELWLCRKVISPLDNVDGKPIGIELLLKVQKLILEFNTDTEIVAEGEEDTYENRMNKAEGKEE